MVLIINHRYVYVYDFLIRKHHDLTAGFEHCQLRMKPVPQGPDHILVMRDAMQRNWTITNTVCYAVARVALENEHFCRVLCKR